MNPNNYATLEASRRLVEAGIVLETEAVWCQPLSPSQDWYLVSDKEYHFVFSACPSYPAPQFAEVWREFTDEELLDVCVRRVPFSHETLATKAIHHFDASGELEYTSFKRKKDANPTDALISLLIWLRGRKEAV
jgi:hypothetical protein